MKNLCRALLIAGVLVLTGWGQMTVKAATNYVNDIGQMVDSNSGFSNINGGDYELDTDVGDGRTCHVRDDVSINLASYQLDAFLEVENSANLTINGSASGKITWIMAEDGRVTQNGGSIITATVTDGEYTLVDGEVFKVKVMDGTFRQSGGKATGEIEICYGASLATTGNYILSGGKITGDIGIGNGSLTISGTGEITGDIDLAGGTIIVNGGTISGNIYLNGGTLQNNGGRITGRIIGGSAPSSSGSSKDKKSKHKKHTTASADYYYNEETGLYGGLIEDVFAALPANMIPASAYPKFNSFLVKKLQATKAGSTLSVNADPWTSINKAVADAFTEKGDIGLALKYTQGDQPCEVTVPAGANLTEQLDENGYLGFAKMGALYGAAPVVETEQ